MFMNKLNCMTKCVFLCSISKNKRKIIKKNLSLINKLKKKVRMNRLRLKTEVPEAGVELRWPKLSKS